VEQSVRTVGVLDKSVSLLRALADGPQPLGALVAATGIPKPTAHRLVVALTAHGLVRRTDDGGFALGAELVGLGRAAAEGWPWGPAAGPALVGLVEATGESAQLYVREGDARRCLLSRESTHELRTIVAEGARLPLARGSAGRILQGGAADGWVESVEERAPGVASVSAPVRDGGGAVVAAVGISGPVDRLGPAPGERFGPAVVAAARQIEAALT
jgi:DNA-binding IclR family transcriptional regulator